MRHSLGLGGEVPEADDSLNSICSANTIDNGTSGGSSQFHLAGRYIHDTHKEAALSTKWSLRYLVLNFALDVQLHYLKHSRGRSQSKHGKGHLYCTETLLQ